MIKKIVFLLFVIGLFTYFVLWKARRDYPIQYILVKNRLYSFLGLEKRIVIPTSKIADPAGLGFPTINKFNIIGYNKSKISYQITGDQLSFEDKKIFMLYTPLFKEVQLKKPKLLFNSINDGQIVCTSPSGIFIQKTNTLQFKSSIICTKGLQQLSVDKLKFNGKLKSLSLQIRKLKVEIR